MAVQRYYLGTSLLVAALVHEPGTTAASGFLKQVEPNLWQISPWVETELASAFAMQCRRGVITPTERDLAWSRYGAMRNQRLQMVRVEAVDFAVAARFCLSDPPPLRAGDALHLALCLRQNSCLASFDRALCQAASQHRVAVHQLLVNG
ncbi:MAG: type II toxin-antitoxin system VapC family toxin [Cyanobacteria bacterium M_surface_10_m2_179]|nr:type II toxin-antitoxin system VapC family toxin [Cyanobacteria bacterium M_surface_10_m2_179]